MINLFYNYFKYENPSRQKEIDLCLNNNLKNKNLNTIIIESQKRLTYSFYFKKINSITLPNDINIICNADIYFDNTVMLCQNMKPNDCYALSRWDVSSDGKSQLFQRSDSQDTWIFKGKIKNNLYGDICLGMPGCDNRIAHEIVKAGYNLLNPSQSIKTYHVHISNVRNYDKKHDTIPGPYKHISPSKL